jgi:hypothetical protein
MAATKRSAAWANLQTNFFRATRAYNNAYLPAVYVMIDPRWGDATPDTYLNGVEGAGLSENWARIALFNARKQRFSVTLT